MKQNALRAIFWPLLITTDWTITKAQSKFREVLFHDFSITLHIDSTLMDGLEHI